MLLKNKLNVGDRFGKLEVVAVDLYFEDRIGTTGQRIKGERAVSVVCDCGEEILMKVTNLTSVKSQVRGCRSCSKQVEQPLESYLYSAWYSAKSRCTKPEHPIYRNYGGRGISMVEAWVDNYDLFRDYVLAQLGEKPKKHSLDRIDSNGNYEPGNLRWATASQQLQSRRNNSEELMQNKSSFVRQNLVEPIVQNS